MFGKLGFESGKEFQVPLKVSLSCLSINLMVLDVLNYFFSILAHQGELQMSFPAAKTAHWCNNILHLLPSTFPFSNSIPEI